MGSGHACRSLKVLLRKVFIVSLVSFPVSFSQTTSFLIVQQPDHLVIYDSFQQSIPSPQQKVIRPYAPMKILTQRTLLGDGLTACMKVEVDGEEFYLLRDDSGKLAGWRTLGEVKTFSNKKFLGDTIVVLASRRTSLRRFGGEGTIALQKGDRCVRYFSDGSAIYAKRLGPQPEFGWISCFEADRGRLWQVVHPQLLRTDLSRMLRDRIVGKINEVNKTFEQVYATLGKETGKKYPVPQWSIESNGEELSCVLRPATAVRFYPKSVSGLSAALQAYVTGTGYEVSTSENRIEIRNR